MRCVYCLPKSGIVSKPQSEILTYEEITRLVGIFAYLGITRVRITGGEPLARKGLINLIRSLSSTDGIEDVSLTTNGSLLSFYARDLKRAGLKRVNISLDTLREGRFKKITRGGSLREVLEGIDAAKKAGLLPVKINTVVMRGINDDEIVDFMEFALSHGLTLRFIEFMKITPLWDKQHFIHVDEVKEICRNRFVLTEMADRGPGPADYYQVDGKGAVGFISTHEKNCRRCNRLRLTSTGDLKACLYEAPGLCLRGLLRNDANDYDISNVITERLGMKSSIDCKRGESTQLYMSKVGG